MQHNLTYRPDIDGLRAFAVLSVIFCHFQVPYFKGGYVGVDVFFVISGYLITKIIAQQLALGTFSLMDFYERRARRILPAFLCMLLCFFVAPLFMPSLAYFEEFYKSVLASLFFVSNLFFWVRGGYFDAPAAVKPLLHTWSLGIEEQFYIFVPFVLLFLWRYARTKVRLLFVIITLGSFLLSAAMIFYKPNSVFYLLPTRAWELFCGSLLALTPPPPPACVTYRNKWSIYINILGILSALLLVVPVLFYDKTTLFPAFAALPPCLGAMLYIYLGQYEEKTWLHRLFSSKMTVFIGLLSYSLYLWHWPIWVFSNLYWGLISHRDMPPTLGLSPDNFMEKYIILFCCLMTFFCAYCSWKYIEIPIRTKKYFAKRKTFFSALTLIVCILSTSSFLLQNKLFLTKYVSIKFQYALSFLDTPEHLQMLTLQDGIVLIDKNLKYNPKYYAIGDSHIGHYFTILSSFSKINNIAGNYANCGVPLVYNSLPIDHDVLNKNNSKYFQKVIHENVRHVLLSSSWTSRMPLDEDNPHNPVSNYKKVEIALKTTLENLTSRGIHVWLIMPTPVLPFDVPSSLQRIFDKGGDVTKVGITWGQYIGSTGLWRDLLSKYQSEFLHIIDPALILCEGGFCRTEAQGKSLYGDSHHLSPFGAEYVKDAFMPFFEAVKATAQ